MIVTANGVEVPRPEDGICIVVALDEREETMGPVEVYVVGGVLIVSNPDGNAVTLGNVREEHEDGGDPNRPWLVLRGGRPGLLTDAANLLGDYGPIQVE